MIFLPIFRAKNNQRKRYNHNSIGAISSQHRETGVVSMNIKFFFVTTYILSYHLRMHLREKSNIVLKLLSML